MIFFLAKNDWGIFKKWGITKELHLHVSLDIKEEDILRIFNILNLENLQYEVHCLNRYVNKDYLFKVSLLIHVERSHALMLKKLDKIKRKSPSFKSFIQMTL